MYLDVKIFFKTTSFEWRAVGRWNPRQRLEYLSLAGFFVAPTLSGQRRTALRGIKGDPVSPGRRER
jgi:hypothetical protein